MPTRDQYERAIALAERDGNIPARDELIRRAGAEMTGQGSFMEKLGAGVQDVVLGTKQLFGQTSPDEIQEHNRIAEQATGGTMSGALTRGLGAAGMAAPAMLIPGAQSVAGAAMIGAGQGALMPTEDDNVVGGKVKNAVLGGVVGGGLQAAAPAAGRVLSKALGKVADFVPGSGARRVAEREFVGSIPQAERAGAEQALQSSVAARTQPMASGVSGAPETAAVATRNPALLATEREAREAGGMLGQPFRDLDERAAQARWQHLEKNVGGDIPALEQAKNDVYQDFLLNAKMRRPFDPKGRLWDEMQDAAANEHNPALKAELERIRDHYMSAYNAGDMQALHAVRMQAFDDVLTRLSGSDKKAANALRAKILDFKTIFDKEMDRSLGGGKWAKFRADYEDAATSLSQGRAGEEFLATARNFNETPGGVPQLTGKRQQMANLATKTDDFGRPVVSPGASDALQTVRREIGEQMMPSTVGPKGSATSQNLNPTSRVLSRAIAAQGRANQGLVTPMNMGAIALMDPSGAAGLIAARSMLDKRALSIAEHLVQIHANPARAAQVLQRANLPPNVKMAVMQKLAGMGAAREGAPVATTMMNQPQEQ